MLPVALTGPALRLLIGVVPIMLLLTVFSLIMIVSLALSKERRSYVLQLSTIVLQLVRAIAPQPDASSPTK